MHFCFPFSKYFIIGGDGFLYYDTFFAQFAVRHGTQPLKATNYKFGTIAGFYLNDECKYISEWVRKTVKTTL